MLASGGHLTTIREISNFSATRWRRSPSTVMVLPWPLVRKGKTRRKGESEVFRSHHPGQEAQLGGGPAAGDVAGVMAVLEEESDGVVGALADAAVHVERGGRGELTQAGGGLDTGTRPGGSAEALRAPSTSRSTCRVAAV